jgi:CBS-domain-containing membrane protein
VNVGDIMTRHVLTVRETASIRSVAALLARHRISGVPVVDQSGAMVGLITEYDVIARPTARTAADAMTRDVVAVAEDDSTEAVRQLLVEHRFRRVPVIRGGQLVGIIGRADLVRNIAHTWVCQVCGAHETGETAPESCPRCGAPSDALSSASAPPVGEGADTPPATCPACGQLLPWG